MTKPMGDDTAKPHEAVLSNGTDATNANLVKEIAKGFASSIRSPILKNPGDYGLNFDNVHFLAQDGVPIEAWFIPRSDSTKLIIANHPRWFNRYGCPTHIEPWRSLGSWADPGNTVEVDFVPDYRVLHDAGYNVLTYDSRNAGQSGDGNGGLVTAGRFESRDVIGALTYCRTREDLKNMTVGIFARCNGANATFFAMHSQPEYFTSVRCLVAAQPLSIRAIMSRFLATQGLEDQMEALDREMKLVVSVGMDDLSPVQWAKSVQIPTFVYQVHDDAMTQTSDVQAIFDSVPIEKKKLHWIRNTTARWDGYLEFQRRPEPMLEWFKKFMS